MKSITFSTILFQDLFDYLNGKLGEDGCDEILDCIIKF